MQLKVIKTEKQYQATLSWVNAQFDKGVKPNSKIGNTVEKALILIKAYEDQYYPIPYPDDIEAIKLKMEEQHLKNKDLVGIIGSKGYVSSILNKRKPLTLELAKQFHKLLKIPAEILLQ